MKPGTILTLSLLALVAGGCARNGIIRQLPSPVFGTPTSRSEDRVVTAPERRAQQPRRTWSPAAPAAWIPPNGVRDIWQCIVIHHSATDSGNAAAFDRAHRNRGWDELGYHFVIGNGTGTPDGAVEVGSRWIKQKHGAHCKTPGNFYNSHGVGICLVGNFEHHQPTTAQMASLEALIGFLEEQCDIPPGRVHGHGAVTGKTACPGRRFPLAALKRRLADGNASAGFR